MTNSNDNAANSKQRSGDRRGGNGRGDRRHQSNELFNGVEGGLGGEISNQEDGVNPERRHGLRRLGNERRT